MLRRAYANFQLERPSKIGNVNVAFVAMASAENTYTRFSWLFDPELSFPGSWYGANVLPGVHLLTKTAIISINYTTNSLCWSSKGRSKNMTLNLPWEPWETSGSASAEFFYWPGGMYDESIELCTFMPRKSDYFFEKSSFFSLRILTDTKIVKPC